MATQPKSLERVRFGAYEFDCVSGELSRDGVALKLQPQPAKVLAVLIRHAGEVVTRQEVAAQVWGSETFVDYEQGLNFAIRQIRTVLEDDADNPRFLETLPKRGYRFKAEVEGIRGARVAETAETTDRKGRGKKISPWVWAAAATVMVAGAALAVKYIGGKSGVANPAPVPIEAIAVLPLTNLSSDPNQEYFSDGLTDELITELAKTGQLRVISRTSVVGFKGSGKRAMEIGRELNVDAIVEGSVERAGNRVRIRAQLIHTPTDHHLWAQSYDRDLGDVFALEREVAQDIAKQIGHRIAQRDGVGRTVAGPAHEDYLKGRYFWNKRTAAGLQKGIEHFQKAIEQEPNYALAHAGLADSYIMLANWGLAPPGESYQRAKAAATKAVELDEQLAEAQTSLAYVTLLYDWDWAGAEKRFRRAIELNPNYASAHHFYSILLMTAGRETEAVAEIKRAQQLDPLSLIVNDVVGWIYYLGRQHEEAIAQYNKTLDMDPNYTPALMDLGSAYLSRGDYQQALSLFQKARAIGGENGVVLSGLAQAHALAGRRGEAEQILGELAKAPSFVSSWDLSLIYVSLGDKQRALGQLQNAVDEHVGWVTRLGVDPAFDGLRREPQFDRLVRQVRIPRDASPPAAKTGE